MQFSWCLPSMSSYSSGGETPGDETFSGISGNPWSLPNEFITAMTETNALNKPVPVRTGRVTVPVRLLGEWASVSPVSKSATYTVEWSADTFGVGAVPDCGPVKLAQKVQHSHFHYSRSSCHTNHSLSHRTSPTVYNSKCSSPIHPVFIMVFSAVQSFSTSSYPFL